MLGHMFCAGTDEYKQGVSGTESDTGSLEYEQNTLRRSATGSVRKWDRERILCA
jgi:hypothetical protein